MNYLIKLLVNMIRALWIDRSWVTRIILGFRDTGRRFFYVAVGWLAAVLVIGYIFKEHTALSKTVMRITVDYGVVVSAEHASSVEFLTLRSTHMLRRVLAESFIEWEETTSTHPRRASFSWTMNHDGYLKFTATIDKEDQDLDEMAASLIVAFRQAIELLIIDLPSDTRVIQHEVHSRENLEFPYTVLFLSLFFIYVYGLSLYLTMEYRQVIDKAVLRRYFPHVDRVIEIPECEQLSGGVSDLPRPEPCVTLAEYYLALKRKLGDRPLRIALSSAVPGDGKTTIALVLSKELAPFTKVVLVNADPFKWLPHLLENEDHVLVPEPTPGVRLADLIDAAINSGDEDAIYIVDLPPLSLAQHVMPVLAQSDSFLFVTRQTNHQSRALKHALERLSFFGIEPDLLVLNMAQAQSDFYEYGYGTGFDNTQS